MRTVWKPFLLAVLLTGLVTEAAAILGANELALTELYGRIRHRSAATISNNSAEIQYGENLHFRWGQYDVLAVVVSAHCAWIQYRKVDAWNDADIHSLLKLNESSLDGWTEAKVGLKKERHWTGGNNRTARWSRMDSTFVFEMRHFAENLKLLKKQRPKKDANY